MKKYINLLCVFCICMLFFNFFKVISIAAGTGTADDPFIITTAEELQNINNNVTAHYILGNDIDLADMDFTPIGNADSGAFSGSFDGNGYKISNLNVFSSKYAGLFGSNEGIIKNVILENIYVYGTRYVGGVVAQNTTVGLLADCSVISGLVESSGGLHDINIAGICGINEGALIGCFSNSANVKGSSQENYCYAGGICGYWNSNKTKQIQNFHNNGNISFAASRYSYSGGLLGYANTEISINQCYNAGNISALFSVSKGLYSYSGGLIGYAQNSVTINESYNTGNIFSATKYNNLDSSISHSGGLVGYANSGIVVIKCYNTGNISSSQEIAYWYSSYNGGLVGYTKSTVTINESYNTGNSSFTMPHYSYSGGLVGYAYRSANHSNSYNIKGYMTTSTAIPGINGIFLSWNDMRTASSYVAWDFEKTWDINGVCNHEYPVLRAISSPLTIDIPNRIMPFGETIQLTAYKNGVKTTDVNWSVTSGEGSVSSNGLVSPSMGLVTVTATDNEGNKANFNAYVFSKASSITATDRTINMASSSISNLEYFKINDGTDYITDYQSSDTSVLKVDGLGKLTPIKVGTATITAITAGGLFATQKVTITDVATSISIPTTLTVNRGAIQKITATTSPNPTTSTVSWKSSDTSVAKVDSNGYVTGLTIGTTTITATTDTGHSATCTVTVNAPIIEMAFETPSLILYTGETFKLKLNITPTDSTDSVTYSSSYGKRVSVSSSGLVTAKTTGTVTITATSTSGQKAYCNVTAKAWPSVLSTVDSTTTINKRYIVTDADLTTKINDLIVAKDGYSVTATPSQTAGDKSYFGTGSTIDVYDEYGNLVITYTLVVKGDLNGDSVCDALDASAAQLYSSGFYEPTEIEAYAANGSISDVIDVNSYQNVVNMCLDS